MQNALTILLVSMRADYHIPEMLLILYHSLMREIENVSDISFFYLQICVIEPRVFYHLIVVKVSSLTQVEGTTVLSFLCERLSFEFHSKDLILY